MSSTCVCTHRGFPLDDACEVTQSDLQRGAHGDVSYGAFRQRVRNEQWSFQSAWLPQISGEDHEQGKLYE